MSAAVYTPAVAERIQELFGIFKLPTVSSELVRRFEKEGKHEALALLLEVLELESGDRRQRRVERLLSRHSPVDLRRTRTRCPR